MKTSVRVPDTVSSEMIRPSLHEQVVPPHWRARRRQITAGIKARVPRGSRCLMCWRKVSSLGISRTGSVKKIMTMAIVRAPKGKFMKKHQRQVYDLVNC